jgi:hypothetical protein
MQQTGAEVTHNLAERLCWHAARRDDARVARRLYRRQVVDGVYRLDEGALLDDFFTSCSSSAWSTGGTMSPAPRSSARWCRSFKMSCWIA